VGLDGSWELTIQFFPTTMIRWSPTIVRLKPNQSNLRYNIYLPTFRTNLLSIMLSYLILQFFR
jgi:hypothetical protein